MKYLIIPAVAKNYFELLIEIRSDCIFNSLFQNCSSEICFFKLIFNHFFHFFFVSRLIHRCNLLWKYS